MLFDSQIHDFVAWLPWVRVRREQGALRAIVEQRRRIMTPEQVAADSKLICEQIEQMSAFREAHSVYTIAHGIRDKNVLGFDPYEIHIYDDNELRREVGLNLVHSNFVVQRLLNSVLIIFLLEMLILNILQQKVISGSRTKIQMSVRRLMKF